MEDVLLAVHRVQTVMLGVKARLFCRVVLVRAAGLSLVVVQLGLWRPVDAPARIPHPQAEVHIVVGDGKLLVQTVDAVVHGGAHQ